MSEVEAPAPDARLRFGCRRCGDFPDLPVHSLDGIRGIDRAPDIGIVLGQERKDLQDRDSPKF